MKTVKFLSVIIVALLAVSCEKQNIRLNTIINENGTCTREVSYSNIMLEGQRDIVWGDGEKISLPIPKCVCVDSLMTSQTEIDKDTVSTTFSRSFSSVEEMSQNTPLILNGEPLKTEAHLEKKFRWFYTEYTFTETFKSIGDKFKVQPEKYANEDVVSYWFTGQPNLIEGMNGAEAAEKLNKMEPFVTKWFNDNMLSIVLDYIEDHYDLVQNAQNVPDGKILESILKKLPGVDGDGNGNINVNGRSVGKVLINGAPFAVKASKMAAPSKEEFSNMRDSLTKYITKALNLDGDFVSDKDAKDVFSEFFHTDAFSVFFDDETPCGKELNNLLETQFAYLLLSVTYTVQMPGTVTDPGLGMIKDGAVLYPITGERLIPHDYTITATSRVVNVWAYIVSILIIVVAIGSFIIKRRKK